MMQKCRREDVEVVDAAESVAVETSAAEERAAVAPVGADEEVCAHSIRSISSTCVFRIQVSKRYINCSSCMLQYRKKKKKGRNP